MRLVALHREDALELVRGQLVTFVEVEVARGYFDVLGDVEGDIGRAASAVSTPGLRTIRVSFGADREDRSGFWRWWRPRAQALLDRGRDQVRRLDVGQARSADLEAQTVDLLDQMIGLEVAVELETGRTVSEAGAIEAVLGGYNHGLDLIQRASDQLDARAENQRTERRPPGPKGTDTVSQ